MNSDRLDAEERRAAERLPERWRSAGFDAYDQIAARDQQQNLRQEVSGFTRDQVRLELRDGYDSH
jgi:hypothetical protein